ncbi:MAG: Inner membrane protein YgaP [Legionellaceae bacterium]
MNLISALELKEHLKKETALLIDVREPYEHFAESIIGAKLIPLSEISCDKLPLHNGPIIIHCKLGKRSIDACHKLKQENPSLDLYSLEGGINAWKAMGFEVVNHA